MYEEPYRWVEAVGNRRTYLDEQFKQGSPVVALSYEDGILLATVSKGTPKLYEIYDRIALGGMGHPADLEKLRFSLLEMAHTEGFNRSPSDVTGARLVKYGVAPVVKQAFEEVYKAPFILKILLVELGHKNGKDVLITINYDGTFEERDGCAVLAATPAIQADMVSSLRRRMTAPLSLAQALSVAFQAWALGDRAQRRVLDERESGKDGSGRDSGETSLLSTHLRDTMADKTFECAVLDRHQPGPSKYRTLSADDVARLLASDLKPASPQ